MLQRAKLVIYNNLSTADFSKSPEQPEASFDAVSSAGVWKDGFGKTFTREMIRYSTP